MGNPWRAGSAGWIQLKSGVYPVHQITFETSRTRPSSSRVAFPHSSGPAGPLDTCGGDVLSSYSGEGNAAWRIEKVVDHERQTPLPEVIADGQACLASADDDGTELPISQGRQLSSRKISRRPLSTRS
jgi:hypothetical protein